MHVCVCVCKCMHIHMCYQLDVSGSQIIILFVMVQHSFACGLLYHSINAYCFHSLILVTLTTSTVLKKEINLHLINILRNIEAPVLSCMLKTSIHLLLFLLLPDVTLKGHHSRSSSCISPYLLPPLVLHQQSPCPLLHIYKSPLTSSSSPLSW